MYKRQAVDGAQKEDKASAASMVDAARSTVDEVSALDVYKRQLFTPCPLCFLNKKLLSGNLEAVLFLFEVISYTQVLQTTDRIGYC